MMRLDKGTLLKTFKIVSFLCLVFLVIVLINVVFNENLDLSTLMENKQKKEKNSFSCFNKSYKQILFKLESNSVCKKVTSNFSYLLSLTENRYIYYSFVMVLGGVLNMKKIVKTGIF